MKFIPILILSIFLTGCFPPKIPDGPVIPDAKPLQIEREFLEPCSLLKENIVLATFEELRQEYGELAIKYANCAVKQNNSVKLIKKFGGIE